MEYIKGSRWRIYKLRDGLPRPWCVNQCVPSDNGVEQWRFRWQCRTWQQAIDEIKNEYWLTEIAIQERKLEIEH
jgi:hypothetical protein